MQDLEKFSKKFPSKKNFYISFSGKGISDKKYQHALKVWYKMKAMKDYHDFYLRGDVLLLAWKI